MEKNDFQLIDEAVDYHGEKIAPTTEWMETMYRKANAELFKGELGMCFFKVRKLASNTLGQFSMDRRGLRADHYTREMFVEDGWNHAIINRRNFYSECWPTITLNSGYIGSEAAWYNTLVHEMCHYYTYMGGYAPRQGHGPEFRSIAETVAYRSNGDIPIQRLATAEKMQGFELNAADRERKERRQINKELNANYIIVLETGTNNVRVINTKSSTVMDDVLSSCKHKGFGCIKVINPELTKALFDSGLKKTMRTYRYWPRTTESPIIRDILADPNNYQKIM